MPAINISYGCNHRICREDGQIASVSAIASPANKVLVGELQISFPGFAAYNWGSWNADNGWGNESWAGHLDTANYLFIDGHVKGAAANSNNAN